MPRGEETILIVEDEPAVRAVAERALKARGYAVLTSSSAEEAESLFSAHSDHISLLLTDVVLPGINGPKLYDRLRTVNLGLKVLYMSGHTGNATVHQGVLDAGVAFMQKPFTLEMIARKVRQVLDS
jgi:DNA-binding NtrC family response regulator